MSLRFRYLQKSATRPLLALGGRLLQPIPLITVALIGPGRTWVGRGLLDTGATTTVFPESVAQFVGIDLSQAPTGTGVSAGGAVLVVRYATVTLRIADGREQREWPATVGFTAGRLGNPLLGFAGFLQFFTATFHGDREEVELTVNGLYPGT